MARGTFQGNLQGTPSRPLEMLTSSKAVTASYAETASRLGVNKVGDSGNPVYFNNGIPVADSKTKGIVDWVTNNSGSISGVTGSSADVAVRVNNLEGKSGSWDSSSKWVGDNSASLLNPATLIISKSLGTPSAGNISYNPFKSASITIAVPSTPGHIGAAPANHTHSTSQVNGLDAFTASVKSDLTEISGKTGSYAPKNDYLPIGGGTITGSLVIEKDLTVQGTTVSIDAQNLNVKDKLILVASGSNTRATADGAGIAVPTASAGEGGAARIQYDGTANVFTSSVGFKAPSFTGSLRGNVTGTASFATSASRAVSAASADTATSASEATHAVSASEAVHAITASHAVNAKTALTASYLENGASIVVNTASYAKTASVAQKVAWTAVDGRPSFYTASFVAGAFSGVQFNPTGGFAQVKVPSITTHISGLDAITASVKLMVSKSASWDNVANTASAAYAAASQALATASVAQKEAESSSYWKTEASKSAASASTFKTTAQTAATQANAASQSAKNAASAANTASGSAKTAATVATNWSLSASNAANIANAASASAQSASNAANVASQSAKTAATVAQGWVTSASKAAQDAEEYRDTASGSMEDARFYSSQAATNATLSSTYAVQSSASAQLAAASASAAASSATNAATYATRAQQSASNAHTSKNLAAASASAAATYATQASQSAYTAAQAVVPATTAANAASASAKNSAASASASAALLYKNLGSKTQPIYLTTNGPTLCDPYSSASVKSASYALVAESVKDGAGLTVDKATKLIGTSGSTSLPVWVNAGVPTAITKLADIPVTASTLRATSNLDVAGNAVISGDLTVKGTTTAIDATHLNVKDTLILLASGSTTQAAANGAGIAIQTASATTQAAREGAAARFQYRSSDNKFTASVGIVAPDFTGNLTGTASYATKAATADRATSASRADSTPYSHTHSNKALLDSLTNAKTGSWDTAATNSHTHSNKAVLDGISAADTASWDAKQAAISDLATIRNNAASGSTAFGWGNHASAGYVKSADITSAINALVTASGSKWSTDNDTKVTAVGNHYTPAQSTAKSVSSGQAVFGIGLDAAGHVVSVTGSNTITSASRAASAASADSATNAKSASLLVAFTNADRPVLFTEGSGTANGNGDFLVSSNITFNPSTKVLKATNISATTVTASTGFRGNLTGNVTGTSSYATTAASATTATSASWATSASRAVSAASAGSATTANTASYVTWANVSGKPSSFTPADHNHFRLVTQGDQRATGSIPNDYSNNLIFKGLKQTSVIGNPSSDTYSYLIGLRGWSDSSGGDSWELAFNNSGINVRHGATTTWGSWSTLITSDNTGSWATAAANSHTHTNKAVLDGITAAKTSSWDDKWTYNEATIKAVKVNNATAADSATSASRAVSAASADSATSAGKLSTGTTGNVGQAVYFSNGTPALTDIGQVACPGTSSAAGSGGTVTLQPGVVTNLGSLTGNVTIALANGNSNVNGHCPIYCAVFTSSGGSITLPAEIDISENSVDIEDDGLKYEISIMNNLAIVVRAAS